MCVYFSKNKRKKRMYKVSNNVYASFEEGRAFLIRENVKKYEFFHEGFGKICKMICMSDWIFVGGDFGLVIYFLQNRTVNYENLLLIVDKRIIHTLSILDFDIDKKENITISLTGNPNAISFHILDPNRNNRYGITNCHIIRYPHNHQFLGAYKILHVPVNPESMIITAGKDDKIKCWKTVPYLPIDNTNFFKEISKPGVIDMICLDNNNICVAFDNFKIHILNQKLEKIRRYYIDDSEPSDYIESKNLIDQNNDFVPPEECNFKLSGKPLKDKMVKVLEKLYNDKVILDHGMHVGTELANVLSGGDTTIEKVLSEDDLYKLELDSFMRLIETKQTQERIKHTLSTGKPLVN